MGPVVSRMLLLFLTAVLPLTAFAVPEVRWVRLGEDLESSDFSDSASGMFFQAHFTLIRSGLSRFRINILRAEDLGRKRASVEAMCITAKANVCINANFFDESGSPLGVVINRGIMAHRAHKGGKTLNGVFLITRLGPAIINRQDLAPENVLEAAQAGPILLANGSPVEGIKETSPASRRSGVCIDNEHRVVFFIASANFSKIPIEALQAVLRYPGIECKDALNLDGGGSAQLYVNPNIGERESKYEVLSIPGRDEVPIAMALSLQ